jgi:DMSO/TMAO reductase YedYZ molybdopterin-dependent catalytic subunit
MSVVALDRLLAGLVVALAATGLLSLRAGSPDLGWVFVIHSVLGGTLFAATLAKLRRSTPRAVAAGRWRRLFVAGVVSLATFAALIGGFAWVASGELLSIGSWTVLTLHAWVGLALVPIIVVHLLPRRWRLLRPPRATARPIVPGRRALLQGGLFALAGVAVFGVARWSDAARGGERRFTGSRWLPDGGIPPVTTFFGEGTPTIDPVAWRMSVTAADGSTRDWSLAELEALGPTDLTAILDCTSGWAIETPWLSVPLSAVLALPDRRPVRVTSVTGWTAVLTPDDARQAVLAMGVAGGELPAGNGAPCRLVVPGRRGLDWVKWVASIRVV